MPAAARSSHADADTHAGLYQEAKMQTNRIAAMEWMSRAAVAGKQPDGAERYAFCMQRAQGLCEAVGVPFLTTLVRG